MLKVAFIALCAIVALDVIVGQTAGHIAAHLFQQVNEVLP